MKVKIVAALSLAVVLVTAPDALAFWGGGSRHHRGGEASGTAAASVTGCARYDGGCLTVTGDAPTVSSPEPWAGGAALLGLLAAEMLRRRPK